MDDMIDKLWIQLLQLRQQIAVADTVHSCCLSTNGEVFVNPSHSLNNSIAIFLDDRNHTECQSSLIFQKAGLFSFTIEVLDSSIPSECVAFLKQYLPYCFIPIWSKSIQRTVAIAHFAQSLDGKVATNTGKSKWIGNMENRVHAHRMRALCDAIMIGSQTLEADRPRLTVRHVQGANPLRIVLGTSTADFSSLTSCSSEEILVIGSGPFHQNGQLKYLQLSENDQKIDSKAILRQLFQRGIYSVYIEGGPTTTSGFLSDNGIDILQLHLAPLILGNGKSCIQLPDIGTIEEGLQFSEHSYLPMGDAIMFTGLLQ